MDWVSNWNLMTGASHDGILFGTQNSVYAGSWADGLISDGWPYVCEKNDQ